MRTLTVGIGVMAALLLGTIRTLAQPAPIPFRADVEKLVKQSSDFRRVLFTGRHVQIVAMSLLPDQDIGAEVHRVDQCFFFVEGEGQTEIGGKTSSVKENDVVCVPAGMRHNVSNVGRKPLKLYTTYSPPEHPPGTVHSTKEEAVRAETKTAH